jgi:hypothetical protein
MNSTTTSRRRYPARATAITIAAVIFGAAACGTETASDGGAPAAPAPAPQAQSSAHPPVSPDAAEREAQRQHDRHYIKAPNGREIYVP